VAAHVRPTVRGRRRDRLAALLEHDAEVERCGRVAACIRAVIRIHRAR
jgi:hypothetical protein